MINIMPLFTKVFFIFFFLVPVRFLNT
jgi:hypothetical protein